MALLGPDELLAGYARGRFPMANSATDPRLFWVEPEWRGVLPLDGFHVPKRLARTVRQDVFRVRINTCFRRVVELCAEAAPDRPNTWINTRIKSLYGELYDRGHAHSVEAWQGDVLVGGLYGVSLHRAFFGESMFSRMRDASKVALVHLVAHLRLKGFELLDTQFITDHLSQFGAVEISREAYQGLLASSSFGVGSFDSEPKELSGASALQSISHTS